MDLAILRCAALHFSARTTAEQSTFAIFPHGLRRPVPLAPLRQPLALEPARTIRAGDLLMGALRMALSAAGQQCSSPHCISDSDGSFLCGSHCMKRRCTGHLWLGVWTSLCYYHSHSGARKGWFDCLVRLPNLIVSMSA